MTFETGLFIAVIVCFAMVAVAAILQAIAIHGWPRVTFIDEIMSSKESGVSDMASETAETSETGATRHNQAISARHNTMEREAGQGDKKHTGGDLFSDKERYRQAREEVVSRFYQLPPGVPPFYLPEQDPGAFDRLVDAARSGQDANQPNPHVSLTPSTRAAITALVKVEAAHKVGMVALLASAFGVKPGGSAAYVQLRQAFIDEQARNNSGTDEPTGELLGSRAVRRDADGRFVVDGEGNRVRLDGTGAEQAEHT